MEKRFRRWDPGQGLLLPPSVDDFVPSYHPARLIRDLVSEELDLSRVLAGYEAAVVSRRTATFKGALGLSEAQIAEANIDENTLPPTDPPPNWWAGALRESLAHQEEEGRR